MPLRAWLENHSPTAPYPVGDSIANLPTRILPGGNRATGIYGSQFTNRGASLPCWRRLFSAWTFALQNCGTCTEANESPAVSQSANDTCATMLNWMFAVTGAGTQLKTCDFAGTFVSARSSYDKASQQAELSFEHLVEFYYGPLYRFAMSLTRTESDAGDLVQDTFLAWAAKGHQLRDSTKVKAWLFTTLHRRFLESQRRLVRFPHIEMDEAAEDLPHVESGLVDQLDAQTIVQMLEEVDPQFQAAVALYYLEDYSYNDIAAILEVPLGTVKSRIARGLAQLRLLVSKKVRTRTLPGEKPS